MWVAWNEQRNRKLLINNDWARTGPEAGAMTITVRTLRNAVDAGFRKLSGAPLKLRRAKLLAELSRAVERGR